MDLDLNPVEQRVLGCLMEKAVLTPEIYPLSLNALTTACNQKTSREPVTAYDEEEVRRALDSLRDKHLVLRVDMAGSRVARFRERASETWELDGPGYAVVTLLLLRGAQTPGQLRSRADRLHDFASLEAVENALRALVEREVEPRELVALLPPAPGSREARWIHRLGPVATAPQAERPLPNPPPGAPRDSEVEERLARLEATVADLQAELARLKEALGS